MNMKQISISIILILGGAAVFVFGSLYYDVFPTNGNQAFLIVLTAVFLIMAFVLKQNSRVSQYWLSAYALFIASAAMLFLGTGVLNLQRSTMPPLQNLALDKFSQFLHVVPVILVLTFLAGSDLRSIFIQKGNLKRGLIFGLLSFIGFAVLGLLIQWESREVFTSLPTAIPWLLLFVFSNALMEELWFRGIFLRKYEKLVGRRGAILVTSIIFGVSHINATYDFPGGDLVFGVVVTCLGLVGAYAMLKDDSMVGPILFHAGYDLMIIVSILQSM